MKEVRFLLCFILQFGGAARKVDASSVQFSNIKSSFARGNGGRRRVITSLDTFRWQFTEDGNYSVKSGYKCDFSVWWNDEQQSGHQNISREVWSTVWNTEEPPRLLSFIWRIINNNIPVKENLKKRGIIDESQCPLCNASPETCEHLFLECPISQQLLLAVGNDYAILPRPSFAIAWEEFTQQMSKEVRGKMVAAMWGIWKVRNLYVFDSPTPTTIHREMTRALSFYEDYMAAHTRPVIQSARNGTRWTPPPVDFIKVNTDAGLMHNQGGQVSAIARDEQGNFIQAAVQIIPAVLHPTLLEAYGVLLALNLNGELSCHQTIIESDCQSLVTALQTGRRNRSDLDVLVDDCLEATKAFDMVRFNFVRRTANTPAHLLAKAQGPFSEIVHYFVSPPSVITDALLQDVATAI